MSNSAPSLEEPRSENKLFGKHKWRGKLFSADSRFGRAAEKPESTDDDIVSFLHTAGSRPQAAPGSAPLAPRIDVAAASRQPHATSVDLDDSKVDSYRRPKPRQNKGLHVRFESAPPAVIGVGGDEAELPSSDVSRLFADPPRPKRSPNRDETHRIASDQRPEAYRRSPSPYDETSFRPSSLQRKATGVDDELPAAESLHADHNRKVIQSTLARSRESSSRPRDRQQDLDLELPETDARHVPYKPCAANEEVSYDQRYNRQTPQTRNQGTPPHLNVPLPKSLSTNSVTPVESRESLDVSVGVSSSSYNFPSTTKNPPKLPDLGHKGIRQDFQDCSDNSIDKSLSLLGVAKNLRDESCEDFDSRIKRFIDLFQLNASTHVDIMALPFEQWVRTSAWWFFRGRGELEIAVRAKSSAIAPASAANDRDLSSLLKQAYFNLAKAWWILKDVIPNLPAIRKFENASISSTTATMRDFGEKHLAELVEVYLTITASFRALTISMRRNGRLPPNDLQMERLESQIFLDIPFLPPEITALTVNNILDPTIKGRDSVTNPFFPMLVADNQRHFSFCKIFVDAVLDFHDDAKSKICIPCVVSILRERKDWAVKAAVVSQDGQVNLVIQSGEHHGGLDWHGVQWRSHTMQLEVTEGVSLQIKFSKKDCKTIWGICDFWKEYSAKRGEEVVYERKLPLIQCFDCPSFPAEPVQDCIVRLFAREASPTEDSGQQRADDGCRLMVITPPGIKNMSKVNHKLEKDSPIFFGSHRSKSGYSLLLKVPSSLRMSLTFNGASDAEQFRSTISGTSRTEDDHCSASLRLQYFAISLVSTDQDMAYTNASRCISDFRWHELRVVNRGPPGYNPDTHSITRREHARIIAYCDSGTFADQVNARPGELQLNLSVENMNSIKLLRAAQQDMTWSFDDGVLGEAELTSLSHILHSMSTSPSEITYHFRSSSDLHSFQAMLTGCHVLYDGFASTFSISRRRSVVPMHKRWEANTPRLQIVKKDKTVQLVAFFKDFSHGACMNFTLKVTDSFDTFTRCGAFFLRIVDAKFALPKGESDPAREFVCLDLPDYPAEHDDIIIGFDSEEDRDRFTLELPAPVSKMSRMASLRR